MLPAHVIARLASEHHVASEVVSWLEERLEAGDPLPYLARRFPESLGGLDLHALRKLRLRVEEGRELESRRANVLKTLDALGADGEPFRAAILGAQDRAQLEDAAVRLRHPKGTRGAEAAGKGLDPLAAALLDRKHEGKTPEELAAGYVNAEKSVATPQEALAGASMIIAERFASEPDIRARVRREMRDRGEVVSKAFDATKAGASRYKDLFDHRERGKSMPTRRYLTLRRGEREKVLKVAVEVPTDKLFADLEKRWVPAPADDAPPADAAVHAFLKAALHDSVTRILVGAIEVDVRAEWKERADLEVISTLRRSLRGLLMRAPFGAHPVLGVDPGVRKGLRAAVVGANGDLLVEATLATEDDKRTDAIEQARALIQEHTIRGVAVGAGDSGLPAAAFFREVIQGLETPPEIVLVPDTGAATIANSQEAREEFGDKPVPVRAAVSMARRLQDPLGEFVRVDPRQLVGGHSIQDVARGRLDRALRDEVEACVHDVAIELNRVPAPLLAMVGNMGAAPAKAIVEWRKANTAFPSRVALARVDGLDAKIYDRAAAFLRVSGSAEPLDETGLHPEHAAFAAKLVAAASVPSVKELLGNQAALDALDLTALADDATPLSALAHVRTILLEHAADPRGPFLSTPFREDVRRATDLKPGMELDGVIRGIAAFGVFVDLGLPQEGLVHVSELADRFVKDPTEVVQVGDHVKVRVLQVDAVKRKISLTMRSEESRKKAEEERLARREAREAARERAQERRRRAQEKVAGGPAPAAAAGAPSAPRTLRPGKGPRSDRGERRQPVAVTRAAVTRRDGLAGASRGRNDRGGPGGRGKRDGRRRPEDGDGNEDAQTTSDKPKREPTAPPANPFQKFFEARGITGS